MSRIIFEERQRFNQWWIWALLIVASIVVISSMLNKYNGNLSEALVSILIYSSVILLLLVIQLRTRIDEQGIHVQMFPFHLRAVTYSWSEIYSAEAVKYSPIGDYGGWGVRVSFRGKGKAFNVRGDEGIKIVMADGKTRMIGTQKLNEAKEVLIKYKGKES